MGILEEKVETIGIMGIIGCIYIYILLAASEIYGKLGPLPCVSDLFGVKPEML